MFLLLSSLWRVLANLLHGNLFLLVILFFTSRHCLYCFLLLSRSNLQLLFFVGLVFIQLLYCFLSPELKLSYVTSFACFATSERFSIAFRHTLGVGHLIAPVGLPICFYKAAPRTMELGKKSQRNNLLLQLSTNKW